eukprot:344734-Hanusia_phi.AAC.1
MGAQGSVCCGPPDMQEERRRGAHRVEAEWSELLDAKRPLRKGTAVKVGTGAPPSLVSTRSRSNLRQGLSSSTAS